MATIGEKMTILDIVAVVTIPLIGVIGYLNYDRQNVIIETQREVVQAIGIFNVKFENHEGRISRNKEDIININVKVNGIVEEIQTIKGKK